MKLIQKSNKDGYFAFLFSHLFYSSVDEWFFIISWLVSIICEHFLAGQEIWQVAGSLLIAKPIRPSTFTVAKYIFGMLMKWTRLEKRGKQRKKDKENKNFIRKSMEMIIQSKLNSKTYEKPSLGKFSKKTTKHVSDGSLKSATFFIL